MMREYVVHHPLELEMLVMEDAQVDALLETQMADVHKQRVLGIDPTISQHVTLSTLAELGRRKSWSEEKVSDEKSEIAQHLSRPLETVDYDNAIISYLKQLKNANKSGDAEAVIASVANAKECLYQLAKHKQWSKERIEAERTHLQFAIDKYNPQTPRANILKRVRNKFNYLGMLAVTGIGGKPEADDTHKKRKLVIGALGATAAVAVGAYFISQGHHVSVSGTHHHISGGQPTIAPTHISSGGMKPPGSHSVTPTQPGFHLPPHQTDPVIPPKQTVPATHMPTEALQTPGDTIWAHAKSHLGNHATAGQVKTYVDKILASNNLTFAKARLLRVGFKFTLPSS